MATVDFSPSPRGDSPILDAPFGRDCSLFAEAALKYKQAAREAMLRDGVHEMFLEDSHWAQLWSKHFERTEHTRPGMPFDSPLPESFEGRTLRVLQWNLLAEGLVPEGFLMPLISKAHVDRVDKYMADLLNSGTPQDFETLARCSSQGHRSMVWREGTDESPGAWEDFARMACDMVSTMKGLPPNEKEAHGRELKARYSPDSPEGGPGGGGQLAVNEHAVVGAEHRLLRVLYFVSIVQPDIICVQELDNFSFLAEELAKLGYACGRSDAEPYVPLKNRDGGSYAEKLTSPWAFAPKWGAKRKKSIARHFLEKRIEDGVGSKATFLGRDDFGTDDDGQAIFWRTDRFQLIGTPEFVVLPGKKDVDAYVDGETDKVQCDHGDQAAVRVLLEFNVAGERIEGQQFFVHTSHLSSGLDCEVYRIQELVQLGHAWGRSGLPEIWALDANTEIDFEDLDGGKGSAMRIPVEANALQNFMQDQNLRSVWEACYDLAPGDGSQIHSPPPASVWKMRGSASAQPKKVGEDMWQLIDHIFFEGRCLFSLGKQALRLRDRLDTSPAERDWLALMPNELLPSDHLPVAWDFELNLSSPRREAPVLLSAAQRIWCRLSRSLQKAQVDFKLLPQLDRLLWVPAGLQSHDPATFEKPQPAEEPNTAAVLEWLCKMAQDADAVLDGASASSSLIEELRWQLIGSHGRRSKEDSECLVMAGFLFAAAAAVSAGAAVSISKGLQRPGVVEAAMLPIAAGVKIALAALRYVLRAYQSLANVETDGSEGLLWGLAAQVTETLATAQGGYKDCVHILEAFDCKGQVTGSHLDKLLVEIGTKLATPSIPNAPALLALRCVDWLACGTGTQVAAAAKIVLRAIEAGNVEFGLGTPSATSQPPVSGSGAVAALALRKEYFFLHQTFDQAAVNAAFTALGESGNLDAGGGLTLLMQSMRSHLAFAEQCREGSGLPERQARALSRPPPLLVASAVRRAVVSACEAVWPLSSLLASAQKLDVRSAGQRSSGDNRSPAHELVHALWQVPHLDIRSQMETVRRILQILGRLGEEAGAAALIPPVVHAGGLTKCKDILMSLKLLDHNDIQRWKTHEALTRFLDTLLQAQVKDDALSLALQASIRNAVMEPEFHELFMLRPEAIGKCELEVEPSYDFATVTQNLNKYALVKELRSSTATEADAAGGA